MPTGIEPTTEIYINPQIIARGSETMLQKLQEGQGLFFTISSDEFKALLSKAIEKDSGHRFRGCKPFYIPNSYFEIHISETLSFLAQRVIIQFRKRADDRGINIFVNETEGDVSHVLSIRSELPDKDELYNEVHFKTRHLHESLLLSIELID